ncbi:MAG: hypothetical protein N2Z60_04890, partial [Elusimicrobiales bacterium]|nr:hypothetical protein [Elusimicrobiales bacterium]
VIILYAGTRGYLDDIELERIKEFEHKFLEHVRNNHQSLIDEITLKKELIHELEVAIKKVIEEFKAKFLNKA